VGTTPQGSSSHMLKYSPLWGSLTKRLQSFHNGIHNCHNPSLGFATKARAYKVASQDKSPGVMSHAPRSVGKCEGMNFHTPKETSTLGVGVPVDSQIFRERLQGSKFNGLKSSLYPWKALGT